jgi:hypothetical protein
MFYLWAYFKVGLIKEPPKINFWVFLLGITNENHYCLFRHRTTKVSHDDEFKKTFPLEMLEFKNGKHRGSITTF